MLPCLPAACLPVGRVGRVFAGYLDNLPCTRTPALTIPDSHREGFSYILTKEGMARASADVGFMFIACNLRRIGNILTRDQLQKYLKILLLLFLDINDRIRVSLNQFKPSEYLKWITQYKNYPLLIVA